MKLLPALLIAVGITGFLSCKKTDTEALSNTQLLTKKSWKMVALTQTLPGGEMQDMFAPVSPCYQDDEFVYQANLVFEANAGAAKCNDTDPQVFSSGTWKFINNETAVERIVTSGLGIGTTTYSVTTLTETTLKLKATDSGIEYNLSFSH
ncbi:MAG: lipocalin family protein [Chitinophagaceae bacterium]|nr:lipocalin family protein [Chitinophagaceae bacterium]